jgi:hypothetical protein
MSYSSMRFAHASQEADTAERGAGEACCRVRHAAGAGPVTRGGEPARGRDAARDGVESGHARGHARAGACNPSATLRFEPPHPRTDTRPLRPRVRWVVHPSSHGAYGGAFAR